MRNTLLFIALASVLACGAWRAHAGATAPPPTSGFPPVPAPTSSRKIDEYGNIRWRDEQLRLDNIAIEARNDPTAVTYLVCYGGRRSYEGEASRRCGRAARYLKTKRGIEAARVVTLDGGFREELTVELWTPSAGTRLPEVSPTVDPSEVIIIKDAPKRRRPSRGAGRR